MRPHPIDFYVGMTRYFLDIEVNCRARLPRPHGFRVIELSSPRPGPYNLYLLLKQNLDTYHAIDVLRRKFGGKWRWLGLKDSKAVTLQLVSSTREVGEFSWRRGDKCVKLVPLRRGKLGTLMGNLFVVDLIYECEPPKVPEVVKVPGYFSYQRFGSRRPVSHVVGKLAIQGKWAEAVDALLGEPTPWESPTAQEIRKRYHEEGPRAYLEAPKFMDLEKEVALALLSGVTPERALKRLRQFELFLQAFQSYVYNKLLSKFEDPCDGPKRLPGPGAAEYSELLEEEGVSFEDLARVGLRAYPREPCYVARLKSVKEGKKLTLIFSLPKGYYATSLIREFVRNNPLDFT